MLRTDKGRRKGTESTQRDKFLDGSRGKAPSKKYKKYLIAYIKSTCNVEL